jgi:hypothetical protein
MNPTSELEQKTVDSALPSSNIKIIFFSAAFHLVFIFLLLSLSITNDSGVRVYPLGEPAYLDYNYYKNFTQNFSKGLLQPFDIFNWSVWQSYPGPILPLLLDLSQYEIRREPLALVYTFIGWSLSSIWGLYLAKRGAPLYIQIFVAGFPLLLYYTHIVSTDLLFAAITFAFYSAYHERCKDGRRTLVLLMFIAILAALVRPNGVVYFPLILIWLIYQPMKTYLRLVVVLMLIVFSVYFGLFYLPYYLEHQLNSSVTDYWGYLPEEYSNGLFTNIPSEISKVFSLTLLFLSKLLYSFGIRPSYAGLNEWLILARALPGVLVLAGVVLWMFRANLREQLFLLIFLAPVFLGASQERYTLGIVPFAIFWLWQGALSLYPNEKNE